MVKMNYTNVIPRMAFLETRILEWRKGEWQKLKEQASVFFSKKAHGFPAKLCFTTLLIRITFAGELTCMAVT